MDRPRGWCSGLAGCLCPSPGQQTLAVAAERLVNGTVLNLGKGAGPLSVLVTPGEEGVGSVSLALLEDGRQGPCHPVSFVPGCCGAGHAWERGDIHSFSLQPAGHWPRSQAPLRQMWSLSGSDRLLFLCGDPSLFHEFPFLSDGMQGLLILLKNTMTPVVPV